METQEHAEHGILTFRPCTGSIDTVNAEDFKKTLVGRIESGHHTIVLDLESVEFMDSSGLGALISAMKHLQSRGEILLCNVRESVHGLLKLTQMVRIFPVFATEEEARNSRMGRVG